MTKRILILTIMAAFILTGIAIAEVSDKAPAKTLRALTGEEVLPQSNPHPYVPGTITTSPGTVLGTTYYDYQTNGSTGNRIVKYSDNSIYVAWMNALAWSTPRHVYYNWYDPNGTIWTFESGARVNTDAGAGYTTIDKMSDGRGVIAYHNDGIVYVSIEDMPGLGAFSTSTPPNELFPQTDDNPGICYWPYVTVDNQNYIHIIATESSATGVKQRMGYTCSINGGSTWSTFTLVDTVMVIGGVVVSSPVSNRVVIAYPKTTDTTYQAHNDIVYISSSDGTTWDFRYGKVNLTNYDDSPDSFYAYTDIDVIIDYNDDVNIIWTKNKISETGGMYYRTNLDFYNEDTDQITTIKTYPDSLFMDICGGWCMPMCKMSLGSDVQGNIFATWTQFDTADVSYNGYGNGELWMTHTADKGATWAEPINITNTPTPGCYADECDSEHWSSLDELVDDSLRITFISDKDAGGMPQTEGSATENPVMYYAYANPYEIPIGIEDGTGVLPTSFSLNQNYPNPFNAQTEILFSLKQAGHVALDIYDITGAKVTTLVDDNMAAGNHSIIWDASDMASGVYFYKVNANGETQSKQAVLIK